MGFLDWIGKILKDILSWMSINNIILLVLGFDTLRFVVASTGWISPSAPVLGKFLYPKYDVMIIRESLKELGLSNKEVDSQIKKMKRKEIDYLLNMKDVPEKVLYILSKNIKKFDNGISYGYRNIVHSNYYINTMEAVHNKNSLDFLAQAMVHLICSHQKPEDIDFIIVPKGGNPLLAKSVTEKMHKYMIITKDFNDSARAKAYNDEPESFWIDYEGMETFLEYRDNKKKKYRGIIVDCNTSGGTQLLNIVNNINRFIDEKELQLEHINNVYVLFQLVKIGRNKKAIDIDKKFADSNAMLYRYFDLDEDDKRGMFDIKREEYSEYYDAKDDGRLDIILNKIKEKKHYHYSKKPMIGLHNSKRL